jgi:hypothetical protein
MFIAAEHLPLPCRYGNKKKVNRAAAATVTLKISGFLSL